MVIFNCISFFRNFKLYLQMEKKNLKGGAEKARLKRAALLKQAANNPKQMKLFHFLRFCL